VPLAGGRFGLPISPEAAELWIFCRISFAQYHGKIVVSYAGSSHVIKVPLRNPLLYPVRSNLTPIAWRLPTGQRTASVECQVTFHLSPAFTGSSLDRSNRGSSTEEFTLLLKTR
jgi:hypothetical protein